MSSKRDKADMKCEVMFCEVVGGVSGLREGRAREAAFLLLSNWLLRCVVESKEAHSGLCGLE